MAANIAPATGTEAPMSWLGGFFLMAGAFVGLVVGGAAETKASEQIALKVAQIDWCPEICPGKEQPGYIVEIVDEAFKGSKFQIEYITFPWSRALAATLAGRINAVIAPAKKEAPNLLYPQEPVGTQRACFYTHAGAGWSYTGPESLRGKKIGMPTDMSLEEIHDYVIENREQFYFQSITAKYLELSIKMLVAGRLDAFAFTENAVLFQLDKIGLGYAIQQAGCVSITPVYIAFTPDEQNAAITTEAMALFDVRVRQLRNNGKLTEILGRYGLSDWGENF